MDVPTRFVLETNYYVKDVLNEMFDHIINLVNRYDIFNLIMLSIQ